MSDKINGAAALDAVGRVELERAMAEVEAHEDSRRSDEVRALDDAEEGEQDDRFLWDRGEHLSATEWRAYRAALRTLDRVPELERAGLIDFKERCAHEEQALDKLDQLDAVIASRREGK